MSTTDRFHPLAEFELNDAARYYEAESPGLKVRFLDVAQADDLILLTSFGSGAGSDSFALRATNLLPQRRDRAATVRSMLDESHQYISYGEYAKLREKIILDE